jgi:hypothetical protein
MVAPEVPSSLTRRRVGVKRSREQPPSPPAIPGRVRPALDADPGELSERPTMEKERRGVLDQTNYPPVRTAHPTRRPPSLLVAPAHNHHSRLTY